MLANTLTNVDVTFRLIGGDILLTSSQQALIEATANDNDPFSPLNAVVSRENSLWKNGHIPYIFDSSLGEHKSHLIVIEQTLWLIHTQIIQQGVLFLQR